MYRRNSESCKHLTGVALSVLQSHQPGKHAFSLDGKRVVCVAIAARASAGVAVVSLIIN